MTKPTNARDLSREMANLKKVADLVMIHMCTL